MVLPAKKSVPECKRNTCGEKQVLFRNRCSRLNENGNCPNHLKLQINATSLELTCALVFDTRFGEDENEQSTDQKNQTELSFVPLKYDHLEIDEIGAFCTLGGKRSQESKCNVAAENDSTTQV